VAGVFPRQPFFGVLYGRLAGFVKVAEAYGHIGMRIEKPSDVEPAMKEAFSRKNDLVFMDFSHRSDRKRVSDGSGRQGFV